MFRHLFNKERAGDGQGWVHLALFTAVDHATLCRTLCIYLKLLMSTFILNQKNVFQYWTEAIERFSGKEKAPVFVGSIIQETTAGIKIPDFYHF